MNAIETLYLLHIFFFDCYGKGLGGNSGGAQGQMRGSFMHLFFSWGLSEADRGS